MNAIVALAIFLFLMALSLWGLVLAVTRRPPDRTYLAAVAIGEVEVVLQAVVALAAIAAGHRPPSLGEYLGYLVATVDPAAVRASCAAVRRTPTTGTRRSTRW